MPPMVVNIMTPFEGNFWISTLVNHHFAPPFGRFFVASKSCKIPKSGFGPAKSTQQLWARNFEPNPIGLTSKKKGKERPTTRMIRPIYAPSMEYLPYMYTINFFGQMCRYTMPIYYMGGWYGKWRSNPPKASLLNPHSIHGAHMGGKNPTKSLPQNLRWDSLPCVDVTETMPWDNG